MRSALHCSLIALALGCGHSATTGAPDGVSTGAFAFGRVVGLRYQTATESGLTDDEGAFRYREGETVTFSIGGVLLGDAPGAATISPFDLLDYAPPRTETAVRAELRDRDDVTGFDRVANMAHLLVSLDVDGDPTNGIDLTGWDAALTSASLSFDAPMLRFPANGFRVFAARHHVSRTVPRFEALVRLYAALDIHVAAQAKTQASYDGGGDGTYTRTVFSYDDAGRLTGEAYDGDLDDHVDHRYGYTYDAIGRPLTTIIEDDDDDDREHVDNRHGVENTYDDGGNLLVIRDYDDFDADGTINIVITTTSTYDAYGNVVHKAWEPDNPTDGTPDRRSSDTYTYDDGGNALEHVAENDDDLDGVPEFRVRDVYTYDTSGHALTLLNEVDYEADGGIDRLNTTTFTYDERGNETSKIVEHDDDQNGVPEYRSTWTTTYDATGHLVMQVYDNDAGANGVDTRDIETRTYDDTHRLLTQTFESDDDLDGVAEHRTRTTHIYDALGNERVRLDDEDTDANGTVDVRKRQTFTYGDAGEVLTMRDERDYDGDGTFDAPDIVYTSYTTLEDGLLYLLRTYAAPDAV